MNPAFVKIDPSVLPLIEQFRAEAMSAQDAIADTERRKKILSLSRKIVYGLQSPFERLFDVFFSLNMMMPIRVSMEMGLFRALSTAEGHMTTSELSKVSGAKEDLIIRMLHAVCVQGLVTESGINTYTANSMTRAMAFGPTEAAITLSYDNSTGPKSNLSACLEFFKKNGYRSPQSATAGPFQLANDCVGETTWDFWKRTQDTARFNTAMAGASSLLATPWLWMETKDIFRGNPEDESNDVFVVDVGEGYGGSLGQLARKYPTIKGRLINQDLPSVLDQIEAGTVSPSVELQKHNFFEPQPIKGASIYFLSRICHDWPDAEAVSILTNIKHVLADSSRIWINEMILPDEGVSYESAALDMTMLTTHCGVERSVKMCSSLVEQVWIN